MTLDDVQTEFVYTGEILCTTRISIRANNFNLRSLSKFISLLISLELLTNQRGLEGFQTHRFSYNLAFHRFSYNLGLHGQVPSVPRHIVCIAEAIAENPIADGNVSWNAFLDVYKERVGNRTDEAQQAHT